MPHPHGQQQPIDIGTRLQAIGAGLQGRGPEFSQVLQQRRAQDREQQQQIQRQVLDRQKAAAQDLVGLKGLLDQNRPDLALQMAKNRLVDLQAINQNPNMIPADPSVTEAFISKLELGIQSGDVSGSLSDVNDGILKGQARGLIPRAAQERIPTSQITERGQLITTGPGGLPTATDIEGFRQPTKPLTADQERIDLFLDVPFETATKEQKRVAFEASKREARITDVPKALVADLSPLVRKQATEAFRLAGGGKEGVAALRETVKTGLANVQRAEVPQILDASFPNASPAERRQLDATVQAAGTVESGLKSAEKIRTEQRRLKKAKGFQQRAVTLLDSILASDELSDVVGSIEGAIDFRFGDVEAEIIADIEEAQNILTAENMDLMTGVLSESDIQILKNLASGALNRKRTFARFKKDAQQLNDKLKSKLVKTIDDTDTGGQVAGGERTFDPATGRLR